MIQELKNKHCKVFLKNKFCYEGNILSSDNISVVVKTNRGLVEINREEVSTICELNTEAQPKKQ